MKKLTLTLIALFVFCGIESSFADNGSGLSRWWGRKTKVKQVEKADHAWTVDESRSGVAGTSSMSAVGSATRQEGSSVWTVERSGEHSKGEAWQSSTTGSGSKTEDGAVWQSTTSGTTESGKSWTAEKSGSATKNDDGTLTVIKESTKNVSDGPDISTSSKTIVTKTDEGRTWTTEGTKNDPKGSATFIENGNAVRSGDQTTSTIKRNVTEDKKTRELETIRTDTKTDSGSKWESQTTGSARDGKVWKSSSSGEKTGTEKNAVTQKKVSSRKDSAQKKD